jgi:putative FmdB family regulatory protein
MPIYEYQCSSCRYKLEELQKINEPPLIKCPDCGKDTLKRLIGSGAGLIFKGSGFYLTDYKNSAQKEKSKTEAAARTESKADSKTASETKPSTKEESKKK